MTLRKQQIKSHFLEKYVLDSCEDICILIIWFLSFVFLLGHHSQAAVTQVKYSNLIKAIKDRKRTTVWQRLNAKMRTVAEVRRSNEVQADLNIVTAAKD